jgi:hypothetical protein
LRSPPSPPNPSAFSTLDSAFALAPIDKRAADGPSIPAAGVLGVSVVDLVAKRSLSSVWRARMLEGPNRDREVALVVVADDATVAVRERFTRMAEDLHAVGEAVDGVLRVQAVAPSRDAFVADLWTTGTARDLHALKWSLRRRLEFASRVARTLDGLHAMGFAHGCLCPENVLLDDDLHPILAEVGLGPPTDAGELRAYSEFASPEVRAGGAPDAASDVYSFGRLLQEIARSDENPEVVEVVRTCLAPPRMRYARAGDLVRALAEVVAKLPAEDAPVAAAPAVSPVRVPATPEPRPAPRDSGEHGAPRAIGSPSPREALRAESVLGRRAPLVGGSGLLFVGLAIVGAFLVGGSDATLRGAFGVCVAVGAAVATWLLPSVTRAPVVARLALAGSVLALLVVFDPLRLAYARVAQHQLHGSEGARRAAIDEIVRLGRDFRGMSLAGVDLSGLDLTGADLRGVDLSRSDLSRTRLWGAEVDGASFEGARLEGTDLDHTHLELANVSAAACDATTRLPPTWRCAGSRVSR